MSRRVALAAVIALGAALAIHAARAGRQRVRVACTVQGEPWAAELRRDAVILTEVGIVLQPDEGPAFVMAETCEEIDP